MDTIDRIKELCKKKKITVQQLEIELGEKPSSISKTTSNSKAEKLYKIAKYFDVSIEYLMTGESSSSMISLSLEEIAIIKAYRQKLDGTKDVVAEVLGVKRQDTGLQSSSKAV